MPHDLPARSWVTRGICAAFGPTAVLSVTIRLRRDEIDTPRSLINPKM
jgi:hypothetical protein